MELLVGCAVVATLLMKVWSTAKVDQEFAKHGKPSPRLEAKYGTAEAGRRAARYGFTDYLRDAWNDYWPRRFDAMKATRDAKATNPNVRVSFRDRIRTGMAAVDDALKAGYTKARTRLARPPAPQPRSDPESMPLVVETGEIDEGTRRVGENGWEEWTGTEWKPVPEPVATAEPADTTPTETPTTTTQEGPTAVTAPTGEATNFNNTVPAMAALRQDIANQRDQADAARRMVAQVDGLADVLEARQRQIAQATVTMGEHLQARNLDPATLSGVQQTAEALSPDDVAQMLDACEVLKAKLDKVIAGADAGEVAMDQTQRHVVGTYADAAAVVEQQLRGNAAFLNSDDTPGPVQVQGNPTATASAGVSQPRVADGVQYEQDAARRRTFRDNEHARTGS